MPKIDLLDNKVKNARVVLWKESNQGPKYLLVQEQGGLFGLPGGVKDIEDRDILETIKRELKEELDLNSESFFLDGLPKIYEEKDIYTNPKSERFGKNVTFYIFKAKLIKQDRFTISSDLMSCEWCSEKEVIDKIPHENIRRYFVQAIKV